jgi:hypothetical protein
LGLPAAEVVFDQEAQAQDQAQHQQQFQQPPGQRLGCPQRPDDEQALVDEGQVRGDQRHHDDPPDLERVVHLNW